MSISTGSRIKNYQFLIVFIILGIFIRILYHQFSLKYYYFSDSSQYVTRAGEIAQGKPIINPFRFPLYPLIISITTNVNNIGHVNVHSMATLDYKTLIKFQEIVGLLRMSIFIILVYYLFGLSWRFYISSLIIIFDINSFGVERTILTEPTSAFLLGVLILLLILVIKKRGLMQYILLFIIFSLLFLLHPTFIFLPIIIFPFISFYFYRAKLYKEILFSIILVLSSFLIVGIYWWQNTILYGYNGISTISQHNILAKTIQYKLNTDKIGTDNQYYPALKQCIVQYDPNTVFDIIDCMKLLPFADDKYAIKSASIVGTFATQVILNNFGTYINKSLQLIPFILTTHAPDPIYLVSTDSTIIKLGDLWQFIYNLFVKLQALTVVFIILYPLELYFLIKNPTQNKIYICLIGTIVFYVISTSAFFSFINYVRLRHPIEIPLYIFCIYSIHDIFFRNSKKFK